jgi:hypothetical protein
MGSKAAAQPGGAAVTAGYVLHLLQSEVLLARDAAEAGKLTAAVLLVFGAAAAAAFARGDYVAFAASSASPFARLRRLFSGSSRISTAQCVTRWLSSTPSAGASLVTALACTAAIPLLLRASPLRAGRLPRLTAATVKAAAFYAAAWLLLGRAAATVFFLRQLMLAARHAASDRGLALRRTIFQAAAVFWLCRALGMLDMDLLPFIDLPTLWSVYLSSVWVGAPFAGFFQLYLATNAAVSAWRVPLPTLGAFAACGLAFAAAAAACDAVCGANAFASLWAHVGGDAALRSAWAAAYAGAAGAAAPLQAEVTGWYDMASTLLRDWFPGSTNSGASVSAWLGRTADAVLRGGGIARDGLLARGARAAADVARDNALFWVAFHLAKYRSFAALRAEVVSSLQLVAIGAVLLFLAIALAGAADSDWVHAPCFVLGLAGAGNVGMGVVVPFVINPYDLV